MKTIPQASIDNVIRLTRKYAKTGDKDICDMRIVAAQRCSEDIFGNKNYWLSIGYFIYGIMGASGLKKDASNKDVYSALRCIGYEVIEDEQP